VLGLSWAQTDFLVLFGAIDRFPGPLGLPSGWWDDLPAIAGVLGIVAVIAGVAGLRAESIPRWLAPGATAILALGTAFLAAWLIDPPAPALSEGQAATSYSWPAYTVTGALGTGALCGIWLARTIGARR
jgi:hypothetical protein